MLATELGYASIVTFLTTGLEVCRVSLSLKGGSRNFEEMGNSEAWYQVYGGGFRAENRRGVVEMDKEVCFGGWDYAFSATFTEGNQVCAPSKKSPRTLPSQHDEREHWNKQTCQPDHYHIQEWIASQSLSYKDN